MADFPRLKTDAVTQYPSSTELRRSTHISHFVDGSEQRFREFGSSHKAWRIRVANLAPGELAALQQFFLDRQGSYGAFTFFDPWDGVSYPDCRFEDEVFEAVFDEEMRSRTIMTIRRCI